MKTVKNKYKSWYFGLVNKAENRESLPNCEKHHIIPKCLGGSNDEINFVLLTYREHFLAHWLLTKFTLGDDKKRMLHALGGMQRSGKGKRIVTSWMYEISRKAYIQAKLGVRWSEEDKKRISKSLIGKKHSLETRVKMSRSKLGSDMAHITMEMRIANGLKRRGSTLSKESKLRQSEGLKRAYASGKRQSTKGVKRSLKDCQALREGWARKRQREAQQCTIL